MAGWVFWILAAIVLSVGEMLTMGFFLAPFAGGALLAALVDAAGGGTVVSWGIFIVTSLLLLLVVRPIARSHRRMPAQLRTGTAALIGRRGLVVERIQPVIDRRVQVVTFQPQPVITEDNLVVGINSVLYFTITDPKAVTYEVANPLQAIEQMTVTTLRNVIGGMTLEDTLTSREDVNAQLRVVLDEATGKWGIRINRVEIKSVDPPGTIQEAMEKQMRAERDRRAAMLTAEGTKQS